MEFYEWAKSEDHGAKHYREKMRESGVDFENPGDTLTSAEIAAVFAWKAGIEEGKRQAAQTVSELIRQGMPRGELSFR